MGSNYVNYVFRYVAGTDVPIPTHYFVVLTSCKDQTHTPDSCPGWLDVLPFIVPHRPTNIESCSVSIPGEPGARKRLFISHLSCHKSCSI
jgi:ectonucleotide pyrophosphatase/phosphodiesterase family protein 1/3